MSGTAGGDCPEKKAWQKRPRAPGAWGKAPRDKEAHESPPAESRVSFTGGPPPLRFPPVGRWRHLGGPGVVAPRGGGCPSAFNRRIFPRPPVDPWSFLGRIEAPALVVHGEHSPIMNAPSAERVAAAIPRGAAATLAGAHHHLVVEAPERFAEIVLRWSDSAIFRVQS